MRAQLRARLRRLEHALRRPDGRCPHCPPQAFVFYRQGSPEAAPVLEERQALPAPCPACGQPPDVTEIVEVVVCSPEDLRRLDAVADGPLALGQEEGRP
jgi:hypothetical protein